MKSRGHIYMAAQLYRQLNPDLYGGSKNEDMHVTLRTVPDDIGKTEKLKFQVPEQIYTAIRNNRGCFLAGSVGPDFFPDMITGQMRVHPKDSGKWLDMMFEQLRMLPPDSQDFQQALAFYMGWMMHYCGDMYSHQFVNLYSFGWFPSIGELIDQAHGIWKDFGTEVISGILANHLSQEQLDELLDNPTTERVLSMLLMDENALETIKQELGQQLNGETLSDELKLYLENTVRLLKLINGLLNILRHITLETYMDGIIQENLDKRGIEPDTYYDLELPWKFIRNCFTTPAALQRMQELCGEEPGAPGSPLDFLHRYVTFYKNRYNDLAANPSDSTVLQAMETRRDYLDEWIKVWLDCVQYDLKEGTMFPDTMKETQLKQIARLGAAFVTEDEKELWEREETIQSIYVCMGLLEEANALEFVADGIEAFFLFWAGPLIRLGKHLLAPFLIRFARLLIKIGAVKYNAPIEDFDTAKEVIELAFSNPRALLQCKALFKVENLADKLDQQWRNLGTDSNCFNLDCPMMENALQMGKLCLMGTQSLNKLFNDYIDEGDPFDSTDVIWALSDLTVEIIPRRGSLSTKGHMIYLNIRRDDGDTERHCVWIDKNTPLQSTVKKDVILTAPLRVWDLRSGYLSVARSSGHYPQEKLECIVNIYAKDYGMLPLHSANVVLSNSNGSRADLGISSQIGETLAKKIDDARRVEFLSELYVTIETGTDGTDGDVYFCVKGHNGTALATFQPDRGGTYNDFEQGDVDTYLMKLPRVIDIDEVAGFAVYKKGGGDWRLKRVFVTDGSTGLVIGDYDHRDHYVTEKQVFFPLDTEVLKAPEIELEDDVITQVGVTIHTADQLWAGTDNDVYLGIYKGNRKLIEVELDTNRNDREQNQLDSYLVDVTGSNGQGIALSDISHFVLRKAVGSFDDEYTLDQIMIQGRGKAGMRTLAQQHVLHTLTEEVNTMVISSLFV